MHSAVNLLYGYDAVCSNSTEKPDGDLYRFLQTCRDKGEMIRAHAAANGFHDVPDTSEMLIHAQIIDMAKLDQLMFHPELHLERENLKNAQPVLLVIDYAFGTQAYEVMDELLSQFHEEPDIQVCSISIMGKPRSTRTCEARRTARSTGRRSGPIEGLSSTRRSAHRVASASMVAARATGAV